MENVLYEYHFAIADFLPILIPLIMGVVLLSIAISLVRSKSNGRGINRFDSVFFKIMGFIVGPICIVMFILSVAGMSIEHSEFQDKLENGDVSVAEGYVEKYFGGSDSEHFEINGVYFEYFDRNVMNGYHKSASHGGVITNNGQHLKIKYITRETEDNESGTENIILYIAEIE
ncbi:MAG: hypothetical protein ACI4W6_05680 [Acutalibacteraceae bacterium]